MANENEKRSESLIRLDVSVDADHLMPAAANVGFFSLLPSGMVVFDFGFMKPADLLAINQQGPSDEPVKLIASGVSRVVMLRDEAENFLRAALKVLEENLPFQKNGEPNA